MRKIWWKLSLSIFSQIWLAVSFILACLLFEMKLSMDILLSLALLAMTCITVDGVVRAYRCSFARFFNDDAVAVATIVAFSRRLPSFFSPPVRILLTFWSTPRNWRSSIRDYDSVDASFRLLDSLGSFQSRWGRANNNSKNAFVHSLANAIFLFYSCPPQNGPGGLVEHGYRGGLQGTAAAAAGNPADGLARGLQETIPFYLFLKTGTAEFAGTDMNPKITLVSVDDDTQSTIVDFTGTVTPSDGNTGCYSVNLPAATFANGIQHLRLESTSTAGWFIESVAFQLGDDTESQSLNVRDGVWLDDQDGNNYEDAPFSDNWYFTTPFNAFPSKNPTFVSLSGSGSTTSSLSFQAGGDDSCPNILEVSDLHILSSRSFARRNTSTNLVLPFIYPSNAFCLVLLLVLFWTTGYYL
jgi:hypothetical protein